MEPLIESVRKYPCLWNTAAIEYRDQELKDAAWAEVMKEADMCSVKEVKLRWKKLRDSYRDALKRQGELGAREGGGGGAGAGAAAARRGCPWKYMELMKFLQPHMGARRRPPEPEPTPGPPAPANGRRAPSSSSSSDSSSAPEPAARRPRPAAPAPPAAPCPPPPDPLDLFFSGMCQATKRLPFSSQLRVKRALFEAVTAAEEALLYVPPAPALPAKAPPPSSDDDDDDDDPPPAL